jgi:3-oxoacyl-[acyl-carrier protein] reductase
MGIAVVTGASRGLGAGVAKSLAADGHVVAVTYLHDQDGADRIVSDINRAGGVAKAFCFDVRDDIAVTVGVDAIARALGSVDIIVSNAIGMHEPHTIEEQSWEHYTYLLDFCVKSPLHLLKSVVADWKDRQSGCFINIGSESVDLAKARSAPYLAAKAAMIGITRSWAQELGPHNIRVNLVAPGFIPVERHSEIEREVFDEYRRYVPLGRLGQPSDVGSMVAFLASPRANFITGQIFHVNGGRTMT